MAGVDVLLVARMAGTGAITERVYPDLRNLSYQEARLDRERATLPAGVDPCGERGEFRTFCYRWMARRIDEGQPRGLSSSVPSYGPRHRRSVSGFILTLSQPRTHL
jgi:hypothetical protein